jgi:hypothetical protein
VNARASAVPACAVCGSGATRTVGGRLLCDDPSCYRSDTRYQGPGTRTRDQVGSEGMDRGLYVVGTPGVTDKNLGSSSEVSEVRREPELRALIRDHERGLLEPVDVELGELPAGASRAMQKVAADVRLLLGLRLAVDEDRPLPYSARFCAERCPLLRDHRQASRVLRQLVRAGVIECVGALKPRGKPDGTKLYQAP